MGRLTREKLENTKAYVAADEDERQRSRYVAAVGTAGTVLGLLIAIGWAFLPVSTLLEKTLVLLACCALSLASWIGFGAWRSAARFAFVAVAGGAAIICLGALSVAAHTGLGDEKAQASGSPQSAAAAHRQRRLIYPSSGASPSPGTPSTGSSDLPRDKRVGAYSLVLSGGAYAPLGPTRPTLLQVQEATQQSEGVIQWRSVDAPDQFNSGTGDSMVMLPNGTTPTFTACMAQTAPTPSVHVPQGSAFCILEPGYIVAGVYVNSLNLSTPGEADLQITIWKYSS